jgi:hypothetical protein
MEAALGYSVNTPVVAEAPTFADTIGCTHATVARTLGLIERLEVKLFGEMQNAPDGMNPLDSVEWMARDTVQLAQNLESRVHTLLQRLIGLEPM